MNRRETLRRLAGAVKDSFGKYRLAWLVIGIGLLLLMLPLGREEPQEAEIDREVSDFDLAGTEKRLADALSRIDGAGDVTVLLTVQNGPMRVLAEDVDRDGGDRRSTQTVVLSKGSGQQETVTVQEVYPRYQGALLVCAGGDDPAVRLRLTEAVSALTGLGADKISISKGK